MPPGATLTLSPDEVEEAPTLSVDEVEEPTKQQSSAAIGQVTRPLSPPPVPPLSASPLSIATPAPRGTAAGLVTEQQERRGGMPLTIQPPSGSLEAPHPEQIAAVPRPNAALSTPAQSRERKPTPVDVLDPAFTAAQRLAPEQRDQVPTGGEEALG